MFISFIGSLRCPFHLRSNQHVPERMINKIDKTTNYMMENGLHKFFKSFTAYLEELRARKLSDADEDDFTI